MTFEKIDALAKEYILLHYKSSSEKDFESIIKTVEDQLLNSDITEYNTKKKSAEKKIESLYTQIDELSSGFKLEFDKIKKMYLNDLDEQIAFISQEKINYQNIVSGSASSLENMTHFQEIFKENIKKINDFSSNLNKLQSSLHLDSNTVLKNFKKESISYLEQEKKKLSDELRKYYIQKKEELDKNVLISDKIFEQEDSELNKQMKKNGAYIKLNIILLLCLIVGIIDYMIISLDMALLGGVNKASDLYTRILYLGIMPFLFSFGIVLAEVINVKIIKNLSKKFSNIVHLFVALMCIGIVALPFVASKNFLRQEEGLKVAARVLVFWMMIPLIILLFDRYITRDHLKMYIKRISIGFSDIVSKIISPISRCVKLISKKATPIERNILVNVSKIGIKFEGAPKDELAEKIELARIFFKNTDSILGKVKETRHHSEMIVKQFKGGNKIFSKRVDMLKTSMVSINNRFNYEIKQLGQQVNSQKESVQGTINIITDELGKDEENLKNARLGIKKGVLEAFRELEQ